MKIHENKNYIVSGNLLNNAVEAFMFVAAHTGENMTEFHEEIANSGMNPVAPPTDNQDNS